MALACVFASNPKVLRLDEPTNGLDTETETENLIVEAPKPNTRHHVGGGVAQLQSTQHDATLNRFRGRLLIG